jgi:plastocyanin
MRLTVRRTVTTFMLVGLGLAVSSCSDSTAPNEATVQVEDNFFDPASASLAAGGTVSWQWGGSNQHNVTWVTQSGTSNSPTQVTGSYTRNFSAAGTFDYYCTIHGTPTSGMRGSVVVR